jgi:hypothetical protein
MPLSHTHGGSKAGSSSSGSGSKGLIAYHFERTPPMSTYLVAWVVGELAHVEMDCQLTAELPPSPYAPSHAHGRKLIHGGSSDLLFGEVHSAKSSVKFTKFKARKLRHEGEDDDDNDDDDHDESSKGRSIPVRVFGTTDRASQFGLAKEAACHALQTLEELLQVRAQLFLTVLKTVFYN